MKELPTGCGYQGYEFGAGSYPDSMCCGGRIYDCDNCDNEGNLYEPTEKIPCPICREREALRYWTERFTLGGYSEDEASISAKTLIADIRKNRTQGTEPWKESRS